MAGLAPLPQNLLSTTHSDLLSAEQKNGNQQNSSGISAAEDRVSVAARRMARSSTRYTRDLTSSPPVLVLVNFDSYGKRCSTVFAERHLAPGHERVKLRQLSASLKLAQVLKVAS